MAQLRHVSGGLLVAWIILLQSPAAWAASGLSDSSRQAARQHDSTQPSQPVVFQCEGSALAAARDARIDGDTAYNGIREAIQTSAEKELLDGPYTVVKKGHSLPNVNIHDYVSLAPYFWPNPNTPDGLPYVRRDGERNPQIGGYDARPFGEMAEHVYQLSLAGYVTGDRRYGDRAALLIRVWFLNPATRMNPNLQHAQFVQGVNDGRGTGIIESNRLLDVLDGIGLLNASGPSSWCADDQKQIEAWFRDYRNWMQTSANGHAEAAAANNHGSWYAAQLTAYSLFLCDDATAKRTVEAAKERIANQILPDGQQPLELARTRSFGYSTFNLTALTLLANLGQRVGVDLWNYKTDDGRNLRAAIDNLIPYATGEKTWQHEQLGVFDGAGLFVPLRRAAAAYHEPKYDEIADHLDGDRDNLRYPRTFARADAELPSPTTKPSD
jgi:hypothetical protein